MNRPTTHDKPVVSFSERNNVPKPVPNIVSEKSQPPPRPPKPQLDNLINFDTEKPTLDCKGCKYNTKLNITLYLYIV